ncbi:sugar transferase [Phaeovulum vinaykumarii]|uniref:Sugar transferase involved in LPS biosynthesis (Colanic, teichoic acid) n=1 Tax=Phaeovulum vinaykumarii TaxID=407234 RepID=A0A1N7MB58_9RHOB|nr:sugar transferase [Phaeovulum vinaykumarii]SIS83318.1 Sugar transferase involved in LPS biosynthesis (colanic, teichoic acid) [Phaeovulum vinaykumarii]SOC10294.1 lipopolysaccharide/colanic/teichoic acid biosynthesis glycosyltransferase [Phaeovulum vinaykumarii]
MLDLLIALLIAPILLPVIFLLWALVRLDGGPGFFVQPRIGLGGRTFNCIKLRTMAVNAEARLREMCERDPQVAQEWHTYQKLRVDPRITRIGQFLRKTSLDELPQLFNVFNGTMSFVGPRPFLKDQEQLYRAAGGQAYFKLRPGITGPWQLSGRGTTAFVDQVKFDEEYLGQVSLATDLGMMLGTAGVVMRGTGH